MAYHWARTPRCLQTRCYVQLVIMDHEQVDMIFLLICMKIETTLDQHCMMLPATHVNCESDHTPHRAASKLVRQTDPAWPQLCVHATCASKPKPA